MSKFLSLSEILELDVGSFKDLSSDLCHIDKDMVDKELVNHPTVYTYYSGMLVKVKYLVDKLTSDFEIFCSQISNEEMLANKNSGGKATAKYLEDFVRSHPSYQKMRTEVLALEEVYGYIKALCVGLEHKKDMIVQLSANKRSETKLYS